MELQDISLEEKENALSNAYKEYLDAFMIKQNTTYLKFANTNILTDSDLKEVINSTKSFTEKRVGPYMMDISMKTIREKYPSGSMFSPTISTKVDALEIAYDNWKTAVIPVYNKNTEELVKIAKNGGRRTRRSRRRNTKSRKSKRRRTNRRR
jgi:hypothetical protein